MVKNHCDDLGLAYSVVMEVKDRSGVLPSWMIRIDGLKTVLTTGTLADYMNKTSGIEAALVCYMRDHFPDMTNTTDQG